MIIHQRPDYWINAASQILHVSSIAFGKYKRMPEEKELETAKQITDAAAVPPTPQKELDSAKTPAYGHIPSSSNNNNLVKFSINKDSYQFHYPPPHLFNKDHLKIENEVAFTPEKLKEMYKQFVTIRRFEMASDAEYKKKNIRGFCHLYDGQEAVAVGISAATTFDDQIITAYRCHAYALNRGDPPKKVMAEEFGRYCGSSKGKGGSMHLYNVKNNFYGGNGIVGAQIPIGVGLNLGNVYNSRLNAEIAEKTGKSVAGKTSPDRICFALMGDGAMQQGQVYESFNLAALFHLPVVFVVEDNKYSMGTSTSRSGYDVDFYRRGNWIPGIRVDGMNVFQVYEACRAAKQYALSQSLPILLHMQTYRYHGHSMSDAGLYRTGDEVSLYRANNDPIKIFKQKLDEKGLFPEEYYTKVDDEVKKEIKEAVKYAEKCNLPPESEIAKDIYQEKEYVTRGRSIHEVYEVKQ